MPKYSVKGSEVSLALIQEMCALRLSIVYHKPSTDKDEDFEGFAAFLRKSQYVDYLIENGKVQAFFVTYYHVLEINGKSTVVVEPEFAFTAPQYRGGKYGRFALAKVLFKIKLKFWYKSIYMVVAGYPHSFLLIARFFGEDFYTLSSKNIATYEKYILTDFLQRKTGKAEVGAGLIEVPCLHTERSPEHLAKLAEHPYYQWYTEQNPNWQEGYTLGFIVRFSWWLLISNLFRTRKPRKR